MNQTNFENNNQNNNQNNDELNNNLEEINNPENDETKTVNSTNFLIDVKNYFNNFDISKLFNLVEMIKNFTLNMFKNFNFDLTTSFPMKLLVSLFTFLSFFFKFFTTDTLSTLYLLNNLVDSVKLMNNNTLVKLETYKSCVKQWFTYGLLVLFTYKMNYLEKCSNSQFVSFIFNVSKLGLYYKLFTYPNYLDTLVEQFMNVYTSNKAGIEYVHENFKKFLLHVVDCLNYSYNNLLNESNKKYLMNLVNRVKIN